MNNSVRNKGVYGYINGCFARFRANVVNFLKNRPFLYKPSTFRVKHISEVGHFAQVYKISLMYPGWNTIGKHPSGFGMYPEDHIDYPLDSEEKAKQRCKDFSKWERKIQNKPTYKRV